MLDLGQSFIASVARDPDAIAVVDGDLRLTYAALVPTYLRGRGRGLDARGVTRGAHLVSLLQNRWEAATLHWACQLAGIIITPLNWRATADELDYCLTDADAIALVYGGRRRPEAVAGIGDGRQHTAHPRRHRAAAGSCVRGPADGGTQKLRRAPTPMTGR